MSVVLSETITRSSRSQHAVKIRWTLALGVISLAALALRLMALNRHSFWYDEAYAADLCRFSVHDLITGVARDNGNPPFYWVLLRLWSQCFGTSEVALRSLSVIFGVAAVPMLGLLAARITGEVSGLIAAGLLAVSPLAVELSNEARVYALLHLLAIFSMILFLRWVERRDSLNWFAYSISVAAVCYAHYFGFFIPIAQGLALVVSDKRRRLLRPWIGAMILAAILWLPWLPVFWKQIHTPGNLSRMGDRWLTQFAATPAGLVFGRTLAWRDATDLVLISETILAVALVWTPALIIRRSGGDARVGYAAALAWLAVPILVPLCVAMTVTPLYHVRAASIGLPALLLLAASAPLTPRIRVAALAGLLALSAVSLGRYVTEPLKDDWRAAAPVVMANFSDSDLLLLDTSIEHVSFDYYARRLGHIPAHSIGITAEPAADGTLQGVEYRDDLPNPSPPRECSNDIFSGSSVWLTLCVPFGTPQRYQDLFAARGFTLDREWHFKRVDVFHYVKTAGSKPAKQ